MVGYYSGRYMVLKICFLQICTLLLFAACILFNLYFTFSLVFIFSDDDYFLTGGSHLFSSECVDLMDWFFDTSLSMRHNC